MSPEARDFNSEQMRTAPQSGAEGGVMPESTDTIQSHRSGLNRRPPLSVDAESGHVRSSLYRCEGGDGGHPSAQTPPEFGRGTASNSEQGHAAPIFEVCDAPDLARPVDEPHLTDAGLTAAGATTAEASAPSGVRGDAASVADLRAALRAVERSLFACGTLRLSVGSTSAVAVKMGWMTIGEGDTLEEALLDAARTCTPSAGLPAPDAGAITWCAGQTASPAYDPASPVRMRGTL